MGKRVYFQVRRHFCAAAPVFLRVILALSIVSLAACVTGSGGNGGYGGSGGNNIADTGDGTGDSISDIAQLMTARPEDGNPVFFSSSPRLIDRENERDACLRNAAVQAGRFKRLKGSAFLLSERKPGQIGYIHDIEIEDNPPLAESMLEHLEVLEELHNEYGTFMKVLLTDDSSISIPFEPRKFSNSPKWMSQIPEISGYYVGVGSVDRSRLVTDSIENADKAALSELLSQLSVEIQSRLGERQTGSSGASGSQTSLEVARGEIFGYYVLDRWISPDGNMFFSLAVCPTEQFM